LRVGPPPVKKNKVNTPVKIPARLPEVSRLSEISTKSSTNITKAELLNLLKLADIRKIIRKIVYEILHEYEDDGEGASAHKGTPAHKEKQEYLGPMPMEIDVARLENTKDLLAVNGNVNGVDIQCLADSCANVSFIQEEAAAELELKVDTSVKHAITGASGLSKTLGIARNISIELSPAPTRCVIKEDLVILKGYKHREIGLSRACLKRYNYDIHESRKHIALTCDNKDYFIPIIPDANRA